MGVTTQLVDEGWSREGKRSAGGPARVTDYVRDLRNNRRLTKSSQETEEKGEGNGGLAQSVGGANRTIRDDPSEQGSRIPQLQTSRSESEKGGGDGSASKRSRPA